MSQRGPLESRCRSLASFKPGQVCSSTGVCLQAQAVNNAMHRTAEAEAPARAPSRRRPCRSACCRTPLPALPPAHGRIWARAREAGPLVRQQVTLVHLVDLVQAHQLLSLQAGGLAPGGALGAVGARLRAAPRLDAEQGTALHLRAHPQASAPARKSAARAGAGPHHGRVVVLSVHAGCPEDQIQERRVVNAGYLVPPAPQQPASGPESPPQPGRAAPRAHVQSVRIAPSSGAGAGSAGGSTGCASARQAIALVASGRWAAQWDWQLIAARRALIRPPVTGAGMLAPQPAPSRK